MKNAHLVCNAHLDPVWLWEWEEGAAAAISTFRTAADLCDEFNGFIFCHNEAVLYQWIEEYEPDLFKRIVRLVKAKKWQIIGGWHLQPDCNMPSGESFVRQILLGTTYFKDRFGVSPKIAINFDSFGHTRGLVQILRKSGYEGYLHCRPGNKDCPLPANEFIWEGFDGSRLPVLRIPEGYNTSLGKAAAQINKKLDNFKDSDSKLLLWGVGNHGGGASRKDLRDLKKLIKSRKDFNIKHSTPENYFDELNKRTSLLPVVDQSLLSFAVGCYTSQVRIKQMHRKFENELYSTEKLLSAAELLYNMPYPKEELAKAGRDLAFSQFHDILPGSSIQNVEDMALRVMDHGLEELSRLKARAFFALSSGQKTAREGEIPFLVYNPHPYPVYATVECEFQLADVNWETTFTDVNIYQNGRKIPAQIEKELSNINLDWRKRVVFKALLLPSQMNRFDGRLKVLPKKPLLKGIVAGKNKLCFKTKELKIEIDKKTGLLASLSVGGKNLLKKDACKVMVIRDNEDAWGMSTKRFDKVEGSFKLMTGKRSAEFAGVKGKSLPALHIVEDGAVRTVVEALFTYNNSSLCLRYKLPKAGTEVEVELRVFNNEKDKMLKLNLPLAFSSDLSGQTAFGINELKDDGNEAVAQKWVVAKGKDSSLAFSVVNTGSYGLSFEKDELRLSLLRSPAYSGHPISERELVPQDRLTPRIDQGERVFRFFLNGGSKETRLLNVEREALLCNEVPTALSFFPSGLGEKKTGAFVSLEGEGVVLSAVKKSEKGNKLVLRLYEATGCSRKVKVVLPAFKLSWFLDFKRFEVKTLLVDLKNKKITETDLMENG